VATLGKGRLIYQQSGAFRSWTNLAQNTLMTSLFALPNKGKMESTHHRENLHLSWDNPVSIDCATEVTPCSLKIWISRWIFGLVVNVWCNPAFDHPLGNSLR